jgi:hypothetical protein
VASGVAANHDASPDGWISFDAAGQLIDGQTGWHFDHASRARPRAEALVRLACDGDVKVRAEKWTCRYAGQEKDEVSDEDRKNFLFMLFKRVKSRQNSLTIDVPRNGDMEISFEIADDINGHYSVSLVEIIPYGRGDTVQKFQVLGLRFSISDISRFFELTPSQSTMLQRSKLQTGGRPAATDWEAAAIEMARRFYIGDLKLEKVADVQRHLTDWLAAQDVHLSETTVRARAKRYFDAFLTWDSE